MPASLALAKIYRGSALYIEFDHALELCTYVCTCVNRVQLIMIAIACMDTSN